MAHNYTQGTIEPTDLPKRLFTAEDLQILKASGIEWEENGDSYYFFVEEFLCEVDEHPRNYRDVFQEAIRRSMETVEEIVITGAHTCSKMRPGEFGGFVVRITKSAAEYGTTFDLLKLMRDGAW